MGENSAQYSTLMTSTPMYVINNPVVQSVAQSVATPILTSIKTDTVPDQISRLYEQNQELQRKLHNKNSENAKLLNKVDRLTTELTALKGILENVNRSVANGLSLSSINLDLQTAIAASKTRAKKVYAKKSKPDNNCQCCYVAEKPFACDWEGCTKRFRQRAHLEAHRNVHVGQRFSCTWPSCNKSFCRKYSLVEHEKIHRNGNSNTCHYPDCGKAFSSKYGLQRHQINQNHHGY